MQPPAGAVVATEPVVLVGAGDIASCSSSYQDEPTARLLDGIPGTVFTLGDNVYPSGSNSRYSSCYGPTWGRHKSRTRPAPGNSDFSYSSSAYYTYFGTRAGTPGNGFYSYDLGAWHIIALNSSRSMSAGSTQERWLRADLAANTKRCTLAYWHVPRFTSGNDHGSSTGPRPLWRALYEAGADIVISGHEHIYERFAPQTPDGVADPSFGIRQFVVGTGGAGLSGLGSTKPNSQVRNSGTYGVLKLTLHADRYDWEFVPVAGKTFRDSGSGMCHD